MTEFNLALAASLLPKRKSDSQKGDYGKLLIIAGSAGLAGAALLTTRAAVRSGAGLTYLSVPDALCNTAVLSCPEAMAFPRSIKTIMERLDKCDVCVIGPGLGRAEDDLVLEVLKHSKVPVIIDADGINAVSEHINILSECEFPVVLTPHEGEFARLAPELSGSRLERASYFAGRHNCALVLKGNKTLTAFPDGTVYINSTGNPGMAKGGSGDVLTGVIGALMGQLPLNSAIPLGVFLHGLAGDIAVSTKSEYSLLASDVIESLPDAFLRLERIRDNNS